MRILVLCHRFPYPPNKGDRIRSFHIIRHLAQQHQVHLACFLDRRVSDEEVQALEQWCHEVETFSLNRATAGVRCALGVPTSRPLTHCYFRSSRLARRVAELAENGKADLVLACGTAMAPYAAVAGDLPKILDIVDVDSAKWGQYARFARFPKSMIFRQEERRLQRYESCLNRTFDCAFATTRREVELLSEIAPGLSASVVRNGVDLEHLVFDPEVSKSDTPTLVFTGQMDYFANIDAVESFSRQVLPQLQRIIPNLEFFIVGRSPTVEVQRISRLAGVTVTGEVDDVLPYLRRAWVFVAPLRIAQGVQNKVLEAMAAGAPAVVTDRVMEGLADGGFEPDRDLMVATTSSEFVAAVLRLLRDEALRSEIAESARRRLADTYSWSRSMREMNKIIDRSVASRPRRPAMVSFPSTPQQTA